MVYGFIYGLFRFNKWNWIDKHIVTQDLHWLQAVSSANNWGFFRLARDVDGPGEHHGCASVWAADMARVLTCKGGRRPGRVRLRGPNREFSIWVFQICLYPLVIKHGRNISYEWRLGKSPVSMVHGFQPAMLDETGGYILVDPIKSPYNPSKIQ